MRIEIIGTGCPKCSLLEQTTKAAADKLGLRYELEHVKDIKEFAKRGVMLTPALVVDGKVVVAGKVPPAAEVERLLVAATPSQ
ncbi:MAG: thioredoxin family protein [Phycisphaerae bacterium]|jgi:small redox-active disulfide protein 2|nr:TM0996/MTH895 family glutaredoxin-like protein [Phycisphaerae bacterium]MCZ2399876.1 thioredoxin family protein [Phycisphaerae bacterium]